MAWAKDRRLAWKSNLQNYHIWLITPVWLPHDLHGISQLPGRCRAEVICWRSLAILICWCPRQLFYRTVRLRHCCMVPNWGLQCVRDIRRKQKSSEIAKNHRKSSEMAGNNQKWSGKVGKCHVTSAACGVITRSSANGVKIQKYTPSKLWSSSL